MEVVVSSLLPIFFLILFGYFLKRLALFSKDFWDTLDRFIYYILIPSLLIFKLSNASIDFSNGINFLLCGISAILFTSMVTIIIGKFRNYEPRTFTSIFQGSVRFNTYILLALVGFVFGDEGIVLAAFFLTFAIVLLNIVCICIFSIYLKDTNFTATVFIKNIITNPLIISCFIGAFINFLQLDLGIVFNNSLEILSNAALPLGLLSIGVGLSFKGISILNEELLVPIILKLLMLPVIMYIFTNIFSLNLLSTNILLVFAGLPTATSSYILAKQLKGDVKLISSIITYQTLISILTISLLFYLINI